MKKIVLLSLLLTQIFIPMIAEDSIRQKVALKTLKVASHLI